MKNLKLIILPLSIFTFCSCEKENTQAPLVEELLDKTNCQNITQIHDTPAVSDWTTCNLYDGIVGDQGYYGETDFVDPYGELLEYTDWSYNGIDITVNMFTIDLGEEVQLSRFKLWQRTSIYLYRHFNTKIFDLWGGNQLNLDGSLDNWSVLLENAEVVKPSGTLLNSENTLEDIEAAEAGHEFIIPQNVTKVRYIRFVQKLAWNNSNAGLHMSELEFYAYKE